MREAGHGRSAKVASRQRLRFTFAVASAMAVLAAWAVPASGERGSASAARSYGPADRAAVRGSAMGHGAIKAKLPSFAAAARISRREPSTSRPTPALLTHRGKLDKARAEEGLNRSGKRAVVEPVPTPTESGTADPASSFPGIGYGQSFFIPPDVEIAAGPHHIVEAVNGRITVFNKGGTQAQTATPPAFFDSLGVIADDNIFDPQVEFNEYANRFFVLYSTRNDAASRSFMLIAVSNTSDPTQGWQLYGLDAGFDGGTNTNNWCDYPHLGYSAQGTLITCNQFTHSSPATFQYAKIRVLDTSQLTSGSCCAWWDFWNLLEGASSKVFTIQPAAMHVAVSSDGAFLAAAQGGGGAGSNLHVYRVPNVLECCDGDGVGPGLNEAQRSVGSYSSPPDAEQPGGVQAIDTGDARLQYAVFHWPRMYVGHSVGSGSDSTTAFTEFAINQYPNNLTVANDWRIAPGGLNRYYPGADSRPGSDKSQVYSFSNSSTNAGSRWSEIPAATTCTTCISATFTQQSGASTYLQLDTINRNRWGDYLDASRDPNGTGIWVGGEFVSSQNNWGTELSLTRQAIDSTAPSTTANLSPTPNANGWINTDGAVALNATDSGPSGNVSGVRSITYGASGANSIPTTTVNGSSANIPITADGTTTLFYRATDNWGNTESNGFLTIQKDATAPTFTTGPTQSFRPNRVATHTTIPVRIDWAATDATSGVCAYGPLLRRDTPAGPFVIQPGLPATPLLTKARQQLEPGFHRYRMFATDCAGNHKGLNGPPQRLRVKQERAAAIEFSNGWKQVDDQAAFGGGLKRTKEENRRARFEFNGTSVAWGAKRGPGMGRATYRFSGQAPINVNLYSANPLNRRLVAVTNSTAGSHTIVIKNRATPPGHPRITLDFIAWLK